VLAASAESPAASSAAANLLAASGALRTARNESVRTPGQTVGFETPVFDPREPAATAERLAARVSDSGTFFEAHVVQWLRGDRSAEAVQREAQQLVPTFSDPTRAEARAGVQLDALHRQAIALSGPAWSGQQLLLELARDPQVLPDGANGSAGNADQVYVARLKMELPRLGAIEIRLRLAGESVAALVAGRTCGHDQRTGTRVARVRLCACRARIAAGAAADGRRGRAGIAPMSDGQPRRSAAALAYQTEDARRRRAPRIVAKGQGLVADEIIERARAAGVPVHESRELAALLAQVDLDQHIPPALDMSPSLRCWPGSYRLEGRTPPEPQRE